MKRFFVFLIAILLCGYNVTATSAQEIKGKVMSYEELQSAYQQLEKFEAVFSLVKERYVEEKTDEEIINFALDGMLSSLDPHSTFLDEEEMKDMDASTKGEFGGLGIQITTEDGIVKVVSPIDDTPAQKAGVLAGDFITHLDEESIIGMDLGDAVDKMRGEPGTEITLTVRQGLRGEPRDILIVRDIIKIEAVKSEVIDNIGYIRVATFSQKTRKELNEAFEDIGNDVDGYILDLRNNPGGLLMMAIAVSEAFLDGGEVVSTKGRSEMDFSSFSANAGDKANGKPVVVLINQGSASASEIVAGALQDHKRAVIVGTKSFGKGSVQTLYPLLAQNSAVKMTTSRYYTPNGISIQATGIEPDIEILQEELKEHEKDWGKYIIKEADLNGALDAPKDKKKKAKKKTKDEESDEETEEETDYQLDRAVEIVKGIAIYSGSIAKEIETVEVKEEK
jgi:carboxyl-terminal processing protease